MTAMDAAQGRAGSHTDPGRRSHNEDACLVDAALGLYVVADGVGGHQAGEVASTITCDMIRQEVYAGSDLAGAIVRANAEVSTAASDGRGRPGMASTVVAALAHEARYDIAWVGDSRAYLWDGKLKLLTRDHSYLEAEVAAGRISPDAALNHPQRNVILQAVGLHADGELDVGRTSVALAPGCCLLLCSDGVSDPLDDEQISQLLMRAEDPGETAVRMVELALQCGGRDNATAILLMRPSAAGSQPVQSAPTEAVWVYDPATGRYDGAGTSSTVPGATADSNDEPQGVLQPDTRGAESDRKAKRDRAVVSRYLWITLAVIVSLLLLLGSLG